MNETALLRDEETTTEVGTTDSSTDTTVTGDGSGETQTETPKKVKKTKAVEVEEKAPLIDEAGTPVYQPRFKLENQA